MFNTLEEVESVLGTLFGAHNLSIEPVISGEQILFNVKGLTIDQFVELNSYLQSLPIQVDYVMQKDN